MANAGTNHLLYQQGFQTTDNLYYRLQEGLQRARYGDFMASLVLHTTVILEQANLLRELLQDSRTMFNKVMENTQAIKSLENKTTVLERQFLEQNLVQPSSHSQPTTCAVYPQVGEPPVHIMCGPARGDQPPLLSLARMAQTQHVDTMYPYQRPAICQPPPPPPPPPDYPNIRHPILPHQQFAFSGNPVFPVQRAYGIVPQRPPRMYPPQALAVPHHRLSIVDSSNTDVSLPAVSQSTTTITTTTTTTVTNTTPAVSSNRTSVFPHLILPEGISLIPLSPSKGKKAKETSKNEQPSVVIQPVTSVGARNCPKKPTASPVVVNRSSVLPSISINELQVEVADERNPTLKRSTEKGMNLDRLLQKITVLSQNRPVADPVLSTNEKTNSGLPVGSRRRKSYSKQRPQYVSPVYEEEEEEVDDIEEYPEIAELGYLNESQCDKDESGIMPIIVAVEGSVDLSNCEMLGEENVKEAEMDQADTLDINLQEMCNENLPDIENDLFLMQDYCENGLNNAMDDDSVPLSTDIEVNVVELVVDSLISNVVELQSVALEGDDESNTQEVEEESEIARSMCANAQLDQPQSELLDEIFDESIDDETITNDDNLRPLSGDNSICCDDEQELEESSLKDDDPVQEENDATQSLDQTLNEESNSIEVGDVRKNAGKVINNEKPRIPTKKAKISIWSATAYRSRKKRRKPRAKLEDNAEKGTVKRSRKTKTNVAPVWPSNQDKIVRRSKRKASSHDFCCPETSEKIVPTVIIVGKANKALKRGPGASPALAAMHSEPDEMAIEENKNEENKKMRAVRKRKKSKKRNDKGEIEGEICFTQTILTHSDALTAVSALEQLDFPMAVRDVVEDLIEITHLREQAETEYCDAVSSTAGGILEMATLTRAIRIWQEHDYSRFPIELLKSSDIHELNESDLQPQSDQSQLSPSSGIDSESRSQSSAEITVGFKDDAAKTKGKSTSKGKSKSCRRSVKTKCSTCSDCQESVNQSNCTAILESQTETTSEETELSNVVNSDSLPNLGGESVDTTDNLKDVIRTKLQRLRADSSSPTVDREDDYSCLLKSFANRRSVFSENNALVPPVEQNVSIKSLKHRLSFAIAGGFVTGFSEDDETSSLQPQVQCVNIFSIHEIWKYLKSFINDTSRTVLALHQLGNKEIQQFLVLARLCLLDAHKDESDLYFKKTEQTQDLSVVMLEKAIKVLESNNSFVD